ncbi:kinase-like domain-containing protein [Pisolithus microcarpus]|nr:kinase-like domain-containing protein [Pisolithus microcarpus]
MHSHLMLESASNTDTMESALIHTFLDAGLIKKIYGGPYCDIYTAKNILAGREVVAKLWHLELGQALKHKYHIQKAFSRSKGIPHVQWFGTDWGTEVLVMDHSGLSLQDLMSRNCSSAFTVKTVAEIACQAICVLELIHSWDFIHHNIKPLHLLFDSGTLAQEGTVFLPWQECGLTVEEVIQAKVNIFQSSLQDKVPTAFFTFLEFPCKDRAQQLFLTFWTNTSCNLIVNLQAHVPEDKGQVHILPLLTTLEAFLLYWTSLHWSVQQVHVNTIVMARWQQCLKYSYIFYVLLVMLHNNNNNNLIWKNATNHFNHAAALSWELTTVIFASGSLIVLLELDDMNDNVWTARVLSKHGAGLGKSGHVQSPLKCTANLFPPSLDWQFRFLSDNPEYQARIQERLGPPLSCL